MEMNKSAEITISCLKSQIKWRMNIIKVKWFSLLLCFKTMHSFKVICILHRINEMLLISYFTEWIWLKNIAWWLFFTNTFFLCSVCFFLSRVSVFVFLSFFVSLYLFSQKIAASSPAPAGDTGGGEKAGYRLHSNPSQVCKTEGWNSFIQVWWLALIAARRGILPGLSLVTPASDSQYTGWGCVCV